MTVTLDDLAGLPIWLCWQNEEREGKSTKVPWSPNAERHASSTDPSTWNTRAVAERSALANGRTGIGIMLAPLGEGRHLGGIDLDGCIADDGSLSPWAHEIIARVGSYTEISPSGQGVKIYFAYDQRETLPEPKGWRSNVHIGAPTNGGDKRPGIEFYLSRRYFAVTRNVFKHYATIRHIDLDTLREVQRLMEVFAGKPKALPHPRHHDDDQQRLLDAIAHMPNHDLHW